MARRSRLKERLITFVVLLGIALGLALATRDASESSKVAVPKPSIVYWSDGDSGRLANGTKFRLHGIDAPETSPVSWVHGAKCEHERELGYAAKAEVVDLTRGKTLTVTHDYGPDRYGRHVVDLAIDGQDVASLLIAAGHHKTWDYDGGDAKPDWCTPRTAPSVAGS